MGLHRVSQTSIALLRAGEELAEAGALPGVSLQLLGNSGPQTFLLVSTGRDPGRPKVVVDDGRGRESDSERGLASEPGEEGELELGLGLPATEEEPTARTLGVRREGYQGGSGVHTFLAGHCHHTHTRLVIVLAAHEILGYSSESIEFLLRNSIYGKMS